MKKLLFLLPAAMLLQSCITRIFTSYPTPTQTVVTTPAPVVTSPTTVVTTVHTPAKPVSTVQVVTPAYNYAAYLDLQAVAAAFAQSSTIQQFEYLLNNSSIMLSNLDMNGDGYIDYLRVLETVSGYNHVFLIQAVLAYNIYQDVATIIADVPAYGTCYVQVIGAEFIYGPKYIIQPVFARTPLIYSHLRSYGYTAWRSPYYWGHYPSAYTHPAPKPNSHYTACVSTYMSNNHYCNNVTVVNEYHINNYTTIIKNDSRSDYARENPTKAATTTAKPTTSANLTATTATVSKNAESKRNPTSAATTTTTAPSRTTTTTTTPSRTSTTTTTPSRTTSATTTNKTPGTTVSTRISTTGRTTTTTTTRSESGSTTKTVTSSRTNVPTRTTTSTSTSAPSRTSSAAPSRTTTTSAPSRTTSATPSRTTTTTSGSRR